MGGGSTIVGESLASQLHFRSAELVSQSDENVYFYMYLHCVFYKFSEAQIVHMLVKAV